MVIVHPQAPKSAGAQVAVLDGISLWITIIARQNLRTEMDGSQVVRRAGIGSEIVREFAFFTAEFDALAVIVQADDESRETFVGLSERPSARLLLRQGTQQLFSHEVGMDRVRFAPVAVANSPVET